MRGAGQVTRGVFPRSSEKESQEIDTHTMITRHETLESHCSITLEIFSYGFYLNPMCQCVYVLKECLLFLISDAATRLR